MSDITASWITENIRTKRPRLILQSDDEESLRAAISEDHIARDVYDYLRWSGEVMLDVPPVSRDEQIGHRLLGTSRAVIKRIATLALLYRLEKNERALHRIEAELQAVSSFPDWNPTHFLDVAEMAFAVGIALDWVGDQLDGQVAQRARKALLAKALEPSFDEKYNHWVRLDHNWNQVCHGGITCAALAMADDHPELAARTVSRAIDCVPIAMKAYQPDGVYPEGPTYWGYGTLYNVLLICALESALGDDFGLSQWPGFIESARYRLMTEAPSGLLFNYYDASADRPSLLLPNPLPWFAVRTGREQYLCRDLFFDLVKERPDPAGNRAAHVPLYLLWLAQFEKTDDTPPPRNWKGEGPNPIAVFRGPDDQAGFYLGVRAGGASCNHANMDAGSFVLDIDGVRWSLDPGNQDYHEMEQVFTDGGLWRANQDSPRWTLLTKGNFGHSTLTADDALHRVDGFAPINEFSGDGDTPSVAVDLTEVLSDHVTKALRTFRVEASRCVRIIDEIEPLEATQKLTWAMMTTAEVETFPGGALLRKDGCILRLDIIQPANMNVSVQSMDPPPLPYDKHIPRLKRVAIIVHDYQFGEDLVAIEVLLSGL